MRQYDDASRVRRSIELIVMTQRNAIFTRVVGPRVVDPL